METKTAKITAVQENQRSYQSQNGQVFIHYIKFEGSDNVWEYHSKSDKLNGKFTVGQQHTFDCEIKNREYNGKQYVDYRIKPAQQQGGGQAKKPVDEGRITYLSVFSSICLYSRERQIEPDQLFELAERAYQQAMNHSTLK